MMLAAAALFKLWSSKIMLVQQVWYRNIQIIFQNEIKVDKKIGSEVPIPVRFTYCKSAEPSSN